jgi:Protein-arginine deiminase (PAD)
MSDAELRADFDHDGKLSGTAQEYAARKRPPGLILAANIDRDARALPADARIGRALPLDFSLSTKVGSDNDPAPLTVVVGAGATTKFTSLILRLRGENAVWVNLLNANGGILDDAFIQSGRRDFALPLKAGQHKFRLEAKRVPGSVFSHVNGGVELSLVGRDAAGTETVLDNGQVTLARFIVLGDLAEAEHLYICSLPGNQPSVTDVTTAVAGISPAIKLRVVKREDCNGDAWLQDQFQLGYLATPKGAMRAILHMPRLRRNTQVGSDRRNLAELVRTHFLSTDIGLIDDFWERRVSLLHVRGTASFPFEISEEVFRVLFRVRYTQGFLRFALRRLCEGARTLNLPAPAACQDELPLLETSVGQRRQLPDLLARVNQIAEAVIAEAIRQQLDPAEVQGLLERAKQLVARVDSAFRVRGPNAFELVLSTGTFQMTADHIFDLQEKLDLIHDGLVYGGNVEVSPATAEHPFGKVVIGHSDEREMDPEVRRIFEANAAIQPVVAIDTSWLKVGHVDELIAFLPDRTASGKQAILRASPETAFALLTEARALYIFGLPGTHPDHWHPFEPATFRDRMSSGKAWVTRLLRGKLWLHEHPGPSGGDADTRNIEQPTNPPELYMRLVDFYRGFFTAGDEAPFSPGVARRFYRAAISTREIEFFEGGTNEAIVNDHMVPLDAVLQSKFPELPVYKVPVIFDRADLVYSKKTPYPTESGKPPEPKRAQTAAFTPNLANLVYLNGTVLIPHPFGPRMYPGEAIKAIRRVLRGEKLRQIEATVTRDFFRKQGLEKLEVWISGDPDPETNHRYFENDKELAREFADGFPGVRDEDVAERIRKTNSGAFDALGRMKPGWHKLHIPEQTVDLFQAYTHAILTFLGLKVRWIDSWFYHLHEGEIHCGTNVLRKVPSGRRPWWSIPS